MARLPTPGGDQNRWGNILNEYLAQAHNTDGSLKTSAVEASQPAATSIMFDDSSSGLSATTIQAALDETVGLLMQQGTLAARPAAATAGNRALYYATDDSGGTLYRSNGSSWQQVGAPANQAGGTELGRATLTGNATNQGQGSETTVTGLTLTVTTSGRPVGIELNGFIDVAGTGTDTDSAGVLFRRDGALLTGFTVPPITRTGGTAKSFHVTWRFVDTPAAGTYTYTVNLPPGTAAKYWTLYSGVPAFGIPAFMSAVMER